MENGKPREDQPPKGLLARLDRAAEKMNAFLLVLAIGLAILDFTCFWIFRVGDALPPVARISAPAAAANPAARASPAAPVSPAAQAQAEVKPARPAGATAGF